MIEQTLLQQIITVALCVAGTMYLIFLMALRGLNSLQTWIPPKNETPSGAGFIMKRLFLAPF